MPDAGSGSASASAEDPEPARPSSDGDHHDLAVVERGSFAVARCSCGWKGPARRARDSARRDAARHRPG
ncbi:hypothetical protein [Actinacidiphila yanglinensis]|uniref:hypothetical protein n=1 Tax=Actinacidiphila yanglinensis TaxID=310779 RepID=UPI001F3F1EE3|nr:hypothetical protein [Actinacidiphila yanglinensis]